MPKVQMAAVAVVAGLVLAGCSSDGDTTADPATSPSAPSPDGAPAAAGTSAANCDEAGQEVIADEPGEFSSDVTAITDGGVYVDDFGEAPVGDEVYAQYASGQLGYDDLPEIPVIGASAGSKIVVYCEGISAGTTPEGEPFASKYIVYGVEVPEDGTYELFYQPDYLGPDASVEQLR